MSHDGFLYGQLGDGGYSAVHRGAPRHVAERMTPNFELKEGERFGLFQPAKYLPSVRTEVLNHDFFVISAGSPVALDSTGKAVPAGYRLLLALGAGQGPQYTAEDVKDGVRNAAGALVTAGEYVVNSMIAESISVGRCLGVASYDVFRNLNEDVHNPATYKYHNYNRQNGFSVLTNYLLQFPVEPLKRSANTKEFTATAAQVNFDLDHATALAHHVQVQIDGERVVDFSFGDNAGTGGVDRIVLASGAEAGQKVVVSYLFEETFYASPFAGMATWRGGVAQNGLVTFDKDSKWVLYSEAALDDSDATTLAASLEERLEAQGNIVGIVTKFDNEFPKQVLDQVKTAYDTRLYSPIIDPETGLYTDGTGLDKQPGSATDGVPHQIQYAGGDLQTGVVNFKLKL